jgi:hypothetical protein
MPRIDIIAIEMQARRMRADDLRCGERIFSQRLGLCAALYAENLVSLTGILNRALRSLFSWNPQVQRVRLS